MCAHGEDGAALTPTPRSRSRCLQPGNEVDDDGDTVAHTGAVALSFMHPPMVAPAPGATFASASASAAATTVVDPTDATVLREWAVFWPCRHGSHIIRRMPIGSWKKLYLDILRLLLSSTYIRSAVRDAPDRTRLPAVLRRFKPSFQLKAVLSDRAKALGIPAKHTLHTSSKPPTAVSAETAAAVAGAGAKGAPTPSSTTSAQAQAPPRLRSGSGSGLLHRIGDFLSAPTTPPAPQPPPVPSVRGRPPSVPSSAPAALAAAPSSRGPARIAVIGCPGSGRKAVLRKLEHTRHLMPVKTQVVTSSLTATIHANNHAIVTSFAVRDDTRQGNVYWRQHAMQFDGVLVVLDAAAACSGDAAEGHGASPDVAAVLAFFGSLLQVLPQPFPPVVVLGNKMDKPGAVPVDMLAVLVQSYMAPRELVWAAHGCIAARGLGVSAPFDWLVAAVHTTGIQTFRAAMGSPRLDPRLVAAATAPPSTSSAMPPAAAAAAAAAAATAAAASPGPARRATRSSCGAESELEVELSDSATRFQRVAVSFADLHAAVKDVSSDVWARPSTPEPAVMELARGARLGSVITRT